MNSFHVNMAGHVAHCTSKMTTRVPAAMDSLEKTVKRVSS